MKDATPLADIVLETARLRLRTYREGELDRLVELLNDSAVACWLSERVPYPYSREHGGSWIAHVQSHHAEGWPSKFAIALKGSDELIGGIGLDGDMTEAGAEPALGYWLGQPFWRHGYGREAAAAVVDYAFRTLGVAAIDSLTDPDNIASQRVLLGCGFSPNGEKRLREPMRRGAKLAPQFRIARDAWHG